MNIYDVSTFEKEVIDSKEPVLVDFWAPWCVHCLRMTAVVEDFAAKNSDIKVCKINVDENNSIATKYRIKSIPCLVLFKNGEEVKREVGYLTEAQLKLLTGICKMEK